MNEDISKNTLLVLVVLTIIVSLLGTWTVINEATKVRLEPVGGFEDTSTTGKVSVTVVEEPRPVRTTGHVSIDIQPTRG